jgi:hypothetical protein
LTRQQRRFSIWLEWNCNSGIFDNRICISSCVRAHDGELHDASPASPFGEGLTLSSRRLIRFISAAVFSDGRCEVLHLDGVQFLEPASFDFECDRACHSNEEGVVE